MPNCFWCFFLLRVLLIVEQFMLHSVALEVAEGIQVVFGCQVAFCINFILYWNKRLDQYRNDLTQQKKQRAFYCLNRTSKHHGQKRSQSQLLKHQQKVVMTSISLIIIIGSSFLLQVNYKVLVIRSQPKIRRNQRSSYTLKCISTELYGQARAKRGDNLSSEWSFMGGSRVIIRPKVNRLIGSRKTSGVASGIFFCSLSYSFV